MSGQINVGFIGNPNCGKTTLFNAYTGAKLKVANWPGVTVEKKEGMFSAHGVDFKLVDLPGIYSLTSYTMEEKLSRGYILSDDVDVIVDVVDASNLERNLYLTLQLIELGKPVVVALNMMDIVEERGMEIDLHRLPEMLGVPTIPVSARKKRGLDVLMHAVVHHRDKTLDALEHHHHRTSVKMGGRHRHNHHNEHTMVYSDDIEDLIDEITKRLRVHYGNIPNPRWHSLKILEQDEEILAQFPLAAAGVPNLEKEIINQKYDFIEEIVEEVLVGRSAKVEMTEKIDRVLTHPFWGAPVFLGIMAVVFFLTFTIGDKLADGFGVLLELFSGQVERLLVAIGASEAVVSLAADGVIAGVGGILTFLPNIFILFLALAILEDSGYMSRIAYVMDGIMGKIGLSGRAFIPMLLGFGCTVPAVMASRALENPKDRLRTIIITPFMSCSARLPVYVLFSKMFFAENAMFVAYSMYVIGLLVAIIVALLISKLGKKREKHSLLIELPEYKAPNAHSIVIYVWEKVKDYLTKAGTTIFVASVILWVLQNFNLSGMTNNMSESFAAYIGKAVAPLLGPVGLGYWQIAVAIISGLAAKEVVVSSCSVLFEIGNINSNEGMAELAGILAAMGFGAINAYALMVFCLLYTPCVAAVATIKKETNSWKWAMFSAVFQVIVAWICAFAVYQIGSLIF